MTNETRPAWQIAAAILVALALGAMAFCLLADRLGGCDPERYFDRRHGTLAEAVLQGEVRSPGYRTERLRLQASTGLHVEAKVRYPLGARDLPAIVILGGHRTGRDAVDLVEEIEGLVVAAISYPDGEQSWSKGAGFVAQLPAARRALFDTPPALSLLADYLVGREEVAARRMELVGVSLGAPLATVAGARDERFARIWAIHGGGAPVELLDHNLRSRIESRAVRGLAARIGAALVGPLAPERWAGRISPRPFIVVNAEADERIPKRSVEILFASARQPKEMIWLRGAHIGAGEREQIAELVQLVVGRIRPAG